MKNPSVYIYHIAILCTLSLELQAVQACLDDVYHESYRVPNDPLVYTLGRVGKHAVVITSLDGHDSAQFSAAATDLRRTFPNVRTCLLVGISGGVPYGKGKDVHLGDVVVSVPKSGNGGFLLYDCGKDAQGIGFKPHSFSDKPPEALLIPVLQLQDGSRPGLSEMVEGAVSSGRVDASFLFPGRDMDVLFEPDAVHVENSADNEPCPLTCTHLPRQMRKARDDNHPVIHHGLVASGSRVIISASRCRDLGMKYGMLCFETVAAGALSSLDCLSIRGISDYSDSHKTSHWHKYAALVASFYAKELLLSIRPQYLRSIPHEGATETYWLVPYLRPPTFHGFCEQAKALNEFLTDRYREEQYFFLGGYSGSGKSTLISHAVYALRDTTTVIWLSASSWMLHTIKLATYLQQPYDCNDITVTLLKLLDLIEKRSQKPWVLVVDDSKDFEQVVSQLDGQNKISPVVYRRVIVAGNCQPIPKTQFRTIHVELYPLWGHHGRDFLQDNLMDSSLYDSDEKCNQLVEMMEGVTLYLAQCAAFMGEQWYSTTEIVERLEGVSLESYPNAEALISTGTPEYAIKLHILIVRQIIEADEAARLLLDKCVGFFWPKDIPVGLASGNQRGLNLLVNKLVRFKAARRTHDSMIEFSGDTLCIYHLLNYPEYQNSSELLAGMATNIAESLPKPGRLGLVEIHCLLYHCMSIGKPPEKRLDKRLDNSLSPKMRILSRLQDLLFKAEAYNDAIFVGNEARNIYNMSCAWERGKCANLAKSCALHQAISFYKLGNHLWAHHLFQSILPLMKQEDPNLVKTNFYVSRLKRFSSQIDSSSEQTKALESILFRVPQAMPLRARNDPI